MGSKILYSNIESQAYSNINEILDTRSYISDPRDASGKKNRVFVYDTDPFEKSLDFSGVPYIIHYFPTSDMKSLDTASLNSNSKEVSWTHRIIVRSVKEGSSNTYTDVGKSDMLNICDDIAQTFNSKSVLATLSALRVRRITLRLIRSDTTILNERPVYESEFELTHTTRMVTSA